MGGSLVTAPPRYPIFIPSKGRAGHCQTVRCFLRDGVPFRLVVEPSEEDAYRAAFPTAPILITPKNEMRLLGVRNWIRDLSIDEGFDRHWQFDDNIEGIWRWHQGRRLHCNGNLAILTAEEFTDRYTNIGLSGFNYVMFGIGQAPPFRLNQHVYSATLINNRMPYRWRLLYNDDTDLCLQVLSGGLCTVLFNAFLVQKLGTMVVPGGNTEDLYQNDGRLRMARALERVWPGVVTTDRRFQRPQHVVKDAWRKFDTPLVRRTDLDWDEVAARVPIPMKQIRTRAPRVRRDSTV
jgi:hypothetical protein